MLLTTKHRSSWKLVGVTFIFLELCSFTNFKGKMLIFLFTFFNLIYPQPSVKKLIQNAYYNKIQIKFVFDGVALIVLELCTSTNGKLLIFLFQFCYLRLPQPMVMKLLHNCYYHTDQVQI